MSRSPPRQWSGFPSQGSAVGPPPMPNKHTRSPERDRRHSPGYDREAEFRRFQEWEKRNRGSPPPRSPPRSPRRDRSPPPGWVRRSPPRSHPPDWGRSPPQWRRSPPRYPPPRSRSPPRGRSPPRWGPPPPEWDRYRYPPRRSPPRYGPRPPEWDSRRPPPPVDHRWKRDAHHHSGKSHTGKLNGTVSAPMESRSSPDRIKVEEPADAESLEGYELPEYDPEIPLGQKYVIAVSGFFCKICHKFYNSESSAKVTHCKSKTHYEKFAKWVGEKTQEAATQKQSAAEAPTPVPAPSSSPKQDSDEPPAKVIKLEPPEPEDDTPEEKEEEFDQGLVVKEEVKDSDNETTDNQYDPSEPTAEEESKTETKPVDQDISLSDSTIEAEKLDLSQNEITETVEATLYNFRKMRVQQLKENLKKRNLPINGLKPLLLKRLEKALLAEAADAAVAESEEVPMEEQEDKPTEEPQTAETTAEVKETPEQAEEDTSKETVSEGVPDAPTVKELKLVMHESDIETSNRKKQWITDRELERELTQLPGVSLVKEVKRDQKKMGKKTIVEWRFTVDFDGEFPEDGLSFQMESHQSLPFLAELEEE